MSESEKFEAQGKAHAALKQGRSNVATINSVLREYGRRLEEIGRLVPRFLAGPELTHNELKKSMENLETERMLKLVDEFKAESAQVSELQEQVDNF